MRSSELEHRNAVGWLWGLAALAPLAAWAATTQAQTPAGSVFTFQGFLEDAGGPLSGDADFEFRLFDANTNGNQVGALVAVNDAVVTNGIFTVEIDFGPTAFGQDARWLEVAVRSPSGSGTFSTLDPRQTVTSTPQALSTHGIGVDAAGNVGIGTDTPGAKLEVGGNAWVLGNLRVGPNSLCFSDTYDRIGSDGLLYLESGPMMHFWVGSTIDTSDCSVTTTGERALLLLATGNTPNLIGGSKLNQTTTPCYGVTIAGGGGNAVVAEANAASDHFCTVGGGFGNFAGDNDPILDDATYATVAGGQGNIASAQSATVSGGRENKALGEYCAVGGGDGNTAGDMSDPTVTHCTVGGGDQNHANGNRATVGGGEVNTASGLGSTVGGGYQSSALGEYSSVSGGTANVAYGHVTSIAGGGGNSTYGKGSTVGGGANNVAGLAGSLAADDTFATVPGGELNYALGAYSFAAGRRAKAIDDGAFVWADSTDADFVSTDADQFLIRAAGGVGISTDAPQKSLSVNGGMNLDQAGTQDGTLGSVALSFGSNSAEAITSKRTPGGNQFGLDFYTQSFALPPRMKITNDGNIGIGIGNSTSPARLAVTTDGAPVAQFNREMNDGVLVSFQRNGASVGSISVAAGVVSYNAFTGSHFAWTDQPIARGTLVTLTGKNRRNQDDPESEMVYGITPSMMANDPKAMGAYLGPQEPQQRPGTDNPHLVMAVGNGELWVIPASDGGDIKPGDYLISSDVPGCAMKDDSQRFPIGYIVGRAAEGVDWSGVELDDAGIKRSRISVFFESFVRNSEADRLAVEVDTLRRVIDDLRTEKDAQVADLTARVQRLDAVMSGILNSEKAGAQ